MELNFSSLSNKKFIFTWDDPMHTTLVEVIIPNISNLKYSVWGDWGPMYTFELTKLESIGIKYNNSIVNSTQKKLRIDSPMLAIEREVYPYFLIIEDQARDLNFHLYLDKDYHLGKVDIVRLKDSVKLFQSNKNMLKYTYT